MLTPQYLVLFSSRHSEILTYLFTCVLSFLLKYKLHENKNLSVWYPHNPQRVPGTYETLKNTAKCLSDKHEIQWTTNMSQQT